MLAPLRRCVVRRWVAMHDRRPPRTQNANGVENQKSETASTSSYGESRERYNFYYFNFLCSVNRAAPQVVYIIPPPRQPPGGPYIHDSVCATRRTGILNSYFV